MVEPSIWLKMIRAHGDAQPDHPRPSGSSPPSSHTASSEAGPEPPLKGDDPFDHIVRDQDQVWYNPSLDQMVETLQVLLMTNGALEPIPVEYNSYVLHLVEGYSKAQGELRGVERACQEAKQSLERNLEQFRLVADDWFERESQYKAEVKRLEVLLSRSSQHGLEAVTLARANSVVDRSGHTRLWSRFGRFGSRSDKDPGSSSASSCTLGRESQAEIRRNQGGNDSGIGKRQDLERAPTPKILDNNNDFRISEKIRQQDATAKASKATLRSRRARERGAALPPDLVHTKEYGHEFRSPFVDPSVNSIMPSRNSQTDRGVSKAPSSEISLHRDGTSVMPAISAFGYSIQINEAAAAKPVPRNEHGHSESSFKPGDDSHSLLSSRAKGQGVPVARDYVQAPTHLADRNLQGEIRHHNIHDTRSSITRSTSDGEQRSPVAGDNAAVDYGPGARKPAGAYWQSVMGSLTSQKTHSLDPSAVTFVPAKETPRKQPDEVDARIAAILAMASIGDSSNEKR
ncbi:hypothetical protein F5Y14DRAFT_463213 [Nemania sp. NC0429]|nr:hypothetical protein F5Y14DRAFT_463213 [Nemania sp. NC0429]